MKPRKIITSQEEKEVVTALDKNPKGVNDTMSLNGFMEAIQGISAPKVTTKAKKDNIPTINLSSDMKKIIDKFVSEKKIEKEAKAEKEALGQKIIEQVNPIYEKNGFSSSDQVAKSYRLPGDKENVLYVTSDRFSAISSEDIEELKSILGDKFKDLVIAKTEVKLTQKLFGSDKESQDLQKELLSYIPADKMKTFLVATTTYSAVDGFDVKRFSLGRRIFDQVKSYIRQASPSLR